MMKLELRRIIDERTRAIYQQRMNEARGQLGARFRETPRSAVGAMHLQHAQVYALYEHFEDTPDKMVAGFIMHDLGVLPQSYPYPDVTYLPPHQVLECGELWSLKKGAGILARRGAAILAGILQIKAIVVYPVAVPWDGTRSYLETGFVRSGPPRSWPFCELVDGNPIYVQPMVLHGEALQKIIHRAGDGGFSINAGLLNLRFENPFLRGDDQSR